MPTGNRPSGLLPLIWHHRSGKWLVGICIVSPLDAELRVLDKVSRDCLWLKIRSAEKIYAADANSDFDIGYFRPVAEFRLVIPSHCARPVQPRNTALVAEAAHNGEVVTNALR